MPRPAISSKAIQKGRGYELKKGEYVEIEKEELQAVRSKATTPSTSTVSCPGTNRQALPQSPLLYAPDGRAGIDAFAVIRDAMKDQDRVALARIVLTNREHIIAIEPLGKGLLGNHATVSVRLRDEGEYFDDIKNPKIQRTWSNFASHILDTKAAHFDPGKFKDNTRTPWTLVRRKAPEAGEGRGA